MLTSDEKPILAPCVKTHTGIYFRGPGAERSEVRHAQCVEGMLSALLVISRLGSPGAPRGHLDTGWDQRENMIIHYRCHVRSWESNQNITYFTEKFVVSVSALGASSFHITPV